MICLPFPANFMRVEPKNASLLSRVRSDSNRLCDIFRFHSYAFCLEMPAILYKIIQKIFGKNTNRLRHIHLAGKRDRDNYNNKMECLNDEIMDREKIFRGLKRFSTPLIDVLKARYNFTKKYGSLNGMTSAEQTLI